MPAETPDLIPEGESEKKVSTEKAYSGKMIVLPSNTTQFLISVPRRLAASKYGSGCGLAREHSSPITTSEKNSENNR
jgi:hypothetical protein